MCFIIYLFYGVRVCVCFSLGSILLITRSLVLLGMRVFIIQPLVSKAPRMHICTVRTSERLYYINFVSDPFKGIL